MNQLQWRSWKASYVIQSKWSNGEGREMQHLDFKLPPKPPRKSKKSREKGFRIFKQECRCNEWVYLTMEINWLISSLKYIISLTNNLFTCPINVYDFEAAYKPERVFFGHLWTYKNCDLLAQWQIFKVIFLLKKLTELLWRNTDWF